MADDSRATETQETRMLNESAVQSSVENGSSEDRAPKRKTSPVVHGIGLKLVEKVLHSSPTDDEDDIFSAENFEQVQNRWWLDRAMPGHVGSYFIAAVAVCTAVWFVGLGLRLLALSSDSYPLGEAAWDFVKDRQWQMQPLLLFVHFVALRLFKGIYSRNFDRSFTPLDIGPKRLESFKKWFLGLRVNFYALAVATPFVVYEIIYFSTNPDFYADVFGTDSPILAHIDTNTRTVEAYFLLLLWILEWVMFGFYAYLIIAGAYVVRKILRKHDFKDSVDLVLTERQFRPMFNLTAQAGSIVFVFAVIHTGYMLYTKSAGSDIAGLITLVILLGVAFGMTWGAVRRELKGNVQAACTGLEQSYREAREKLSGMVDVPGIEDDIQRIQVQLKMQLALQQLDYLQTKYESLGRKEFLGLIFKMLEPVGSVLARLIRWGSLAAAIGLGGVAAIGDAKNKEGNAPAAVESPEEPSAKGEAADR
ncbi:MAG: hypothetical protein L3J82_09895 [Planctomycetes bacterium]|nr:hypothetical protein [Planctomycetota bacterium]